MPAYLLAHDLGTSGNKATLFGTDGELVASRTCSYETNYFHSNWAEQDPEDWWRAVCESTRQILAEVDAADIASVALSGQMMGCTPVDRDGTPLRPSLLYCDQRATDEAEHILSRISPEDFYAIVGHRVSSSYTIEKLMWLKNNEPDTYAKTYKTLCAKDFVNFRLTGEMATDRSDASGTNAFDLNASGWSEKIIDIAGVDGGMFPEVKDSTDVLGTITAAAAEATGLKEGTPVVVGGGDGSCAGVGVGCIAPGMAYNYLGSSSWIALATEKPIVDEKMRTMTWAHCVPGLLQPSGTMQTAGSSYSWLKNEICRLEQEEAKRAGVSAYELINRQIARSPVGANGVLFLPYLLGERTPRWNPNAKGAFVGITLATKREDMLRAVLEGITMNLGIILEIFRGHVTIDSMRVIGGGAKGDVWRQLLADVYGCPIEKLNYLEEATSMGAAVVGGVGVGVFEDFLASEREAGGNRRPRAQAGGGGAVRRPLHLGGPQDDGRALRRPRVRGQARQLPHDPPPAPAQRSRARRVGGRVRRPVGQANRQGHRRRRQQARHAGNA
ncbi:MAG: xylulokinase [Planctomycetota bacterium]|jgi:xylulokinase